MISSLDSFRLHFPIGVRAEVAVLPDEHGALHVPDEPRRPIANGVPLHVALFKLLILNDLFGGERGIRTLVTRFSSLLMARDFLV